MRSPRPKSNILVTCGGKWVGFVVQLREAMARNRQLTGSRIVVASSDAVTPAGCFADDAVVVPPIKDPEYVPTLLRICEAHAVRIVVPLLDLDLQSLAPHLGCFEQMGTTVICPSSELVQLCLDKLAFAEFAQAHKLSQPRRYSATELSGASYPVFYKPRFGFGSIGSGVCVSIEAASTLLTRSGEFIFQEFVTAPEITVDAYLSRDGACTICIPRVRDKVVAGESYKTRTVAAPAARDLALRTVAALSSRGLRGPLNVQIFDTDPPCLIEVNTRLGSGCVLSNVACEGRLFDAVLHEGLGGTWRGDPHHFTVGVGLSRFLGDVFHVGTSVVDIKPR